MDEKKKGYTAHQWMMALLDMLDGSASPDEIRNATGLSKSRCEEISAMYYQATENGWPKESEK
jgi:hypothetical protein